MKQAFSISAQFNHPLTNLKSFWKWFKEVFIFQDKDAVSQFLMNLRWHAKEIFLCLLLTMLIAKVDKARHFFSAFAQDIQENQLGWLIFSLVFLLNGFFVMWLSYVLWHKPKNVKGWINKIFGNRKDRSYEVYYTKPEGLWWVAVVSSLPVLVVNTALSIALMQNSDLERSEDMNWLEKLVTNSPFGSSLIAFVLFLLFSSAFKPRFEDERDTNTLKKVFRICLAQYGLIILFYLLVFCNFHVIRHFAVLKFIVLSGFAIKVPIMLSHVWFSLSRCLMREKNQEEIEGNTGKKRPLDYYFDLFRFSSYLASIALYLVLNQSAIATQYWFSLAMPAIPILLFVVIFYYQLWDFILHNVTRMRRNIALVALLLSIMFWGQTEHFALKYRAQTPAATLVRTDIKDYFLQWSRARFDSNPADNVCFLVAVEGGGSRSGAWSSSILTQLDAKTGGAFRRQCFAFSTVSGGTVGTASVLALWDHANRFHTPIDTLYPLRPSLNEPGELKPALDSSYIYSMFRRNYITSAISGIFFYDFWQTVPLIHWLFPKNYCRSDRQQLEENEAMVRGLNHIFPKEKDKIDPHYYLKTNFLRLFYKQSERDTQPIVSTDLPLFFSNTARVDDGRRGVISPVNMNNHDKKTNDVARYPFISAIDLVGQAAEENQHRSLGFSEAVIVSQLFPYVSANLTVSKGIGTYMDGGYYENMGLTTLNEIANSIESIRRDTLNIEAKYAANSTKLTAFRQFVQKTKLRIILIYNTRIINSETLCEERKSMKFIDPLSGLIQTPFGGHTEHMYKQTLRSFGAENIFEFPLMERNNNCDKTGEKIVMSRWLSISDMRAISKRAEKITLDTLRSGRLYK